MDILHETIIPCHYGVVVYKKGGNKYLLESSLLTHKFKYKINVFVIFSFYNIMKFDNVWMVTKFLKKHDFPEGSLSISLIAEGIKYLLDRNNFPSSSVNCFPYNAICLSKIQKKKKKMK